MKGVLSRTPYRRWLFTCQALLTVTVAIGSLPSFAATPTGGPDLIWRGKLQSWMGVRMDIHGESVTLFAEPMEIAVTLSVRCSNPLPAYPVNVSAKVTQGDAILTILQQPRTGNGFTATLLLKQSSPWPDVVEQEIAFTWGEEVKPEATPTPWPTWNPSAPTPTPIQGAPNLLWVVREEAFSDDPRHQGYGFIEFQDMVAELGAESEHVLAGPQTITDDLLGGYAAVIFGDTRDVPPLSDAERESVVRFVRGGGSIFVMGQQDFRYVLEPSAIYASSITDPFGIRFSLTISGEYTDFKSHPLVSAVSRLDGVGGSVLLVESPAEAIGFAEDGETILAVAEGGYGRVVAFTDEYLFLDRQIGSSSSNTQFARNIAIWLLHLEETRLRTPTPTYRPDSPEGEAFALVQSMLDANKPWLDPKPIRATYSLVRNSEKLGSFSVDGGGPNPLRVGSIIQTPLHHMMHSRVAYGVRMAGKRTVNGTPVIAVDVTFEDWVMDRIGMGGQSGTQYHYRGIGILACRILIEPQKATPVFIGCSKSLELLGSESYITSWAFDPDFYEVDGGYAPRVLQADEHYLGVELPPGFPVWSFDERFKFRLVDSVWILEEGEAWYTQFSDRTGAVPPIQLVDLAITTIGSTEETSAEAWAVH